MLQTCLLVVIIMSTLMNWERLWPNSQKVLGLVKQPFPINTLIAKKKCNFGLRGFQTWWVLYKFTFLIFNMQWDYSSDWFSSADCVQEGGHACKLECESLQAHDDACNVITAVGVHYLEWWWVYDPAYCQCRRCWKALPRLPSGGCAFWEEIHPHYCSAKLRQNY